MGPYEIVGLLGAGGMGEVYKAIDTRLDRTVAVKILRIPHTEHFLREARVVAALNHPHICTLHDIGPNYLVMEYVDGVPLQGPMPPNEVVRLALEIAGALRAAHAKDIIHRDLKPGNILVTSAGVKLLDFGLAKLPQAASAVADNRDTETLSGTIMGTTAYMSPEQAQGLPVDARSDIFSLGSVLYELVTGRRAFRAESQAATLAAVLRDEPAPLETWPALQEVVFRCLRKSAADRFETAAALEIALRRIPAQPVSRQPSIAVLPFRNLSADPDNEYFSDGLAEEIIGALAQIPGLKVIARSSAFAFKGKPEDVRRVAEILGVGHILEGSVRRAGSRIRVTAQLIAASDGSHLWSQRYDREMTDIFAIQDDISQAIAGALRVTLIAPQRRSASLQAYENYLNGTYHCQRNTPDGLAKAQVFFEQALAIDPGYALAHAGLASYYFNLAGLAIQPGREIMSLAKLAAERAVAIDPALNEARSVLGVAAATLDYDWELAEHEFRVATAASPVPSWVRFRFAYFLLVPRGRLAEASEQFRLILETDPLFQLAYYGESFTRCMQGDYGGALQRCAQALDLDANSWLAYLVKGLAELGTGRAGESVSSLERCRQLAPWNTTSIGYLACSYVTAGLPERAERLLDESLRHWSNTDLALARAFYHGARGEVDRMFECLEKAFADRNVLLSSVWWQAPFRSYEADPRCQALLRAMNLR